MNKERWTCGTCNATIPAGVYHACPPKVEEKMTEEEKDRQEFKDWWSTPHYQEIVKLERFTGTPENWAELAWLERGRREETSRQKMREEMERLEVECDNQSSTIEMYQGALKECEEKVSQVESKSEELQKSFETAIDGYGKAAEKVEQLESELASLNSHCLIMYQEGQHEHDLMEEWHQKALKLEEWQERSMKDYVDLHVKYKHLEFDLARLRGESLESTMTEEEKFEKWWKKDGYHLEDGKFYESMRHVWLTARKEMRGEILQLNQIVSQAEEMEREAQEKIKQVEAELAINASLLARQTDLARNAEVEVMKLESELARLRGESPDAGFGSMRRWEQKVTLMNLDEAVKRACAEPTLLDALSWICVWESERAINQARFNFGSGANGAGWDTCFKTCLERVIKEISETRFRTGKR